MRFKINIMIKFCFREIYYYYMREILRRFSDVIVLGSSRIFSRLVVTKKPTYLYNPPLAPSRSLFLSPRGET